jgi:Fe2+ transport system protein B
MITGGHCGQKLWHLSTVADHLQSWQTPANKSTSFDSLYRNVRKPITLSEHFHHQMTFKIFPSILCTHLHYSVLGNNTPRLLQITDAYCHIIFVLLQVLCISKYKHIFRTTANLAWTLVTWSTYQISWKSTCWCKMIRQWHNYSYFMYDGLMDRKTDKQTDMTKLTGAFCHCANAPKFVPI